MTLFRFLDSDKAGVAIQKTFFDALALALKDYKSILGVQNEGKELEKAKEQVESLQKIYSECVEMLNDYQMNIIARVQEIEDKCKR